MMPDENAIKTDERRARIERGLAQFISPGIAEWFSDACRLMDLALTGPPPVAVKTVSHLVAHILREIESALGSVLKSIPGPAAVDEEDRVSVLERDFRTVLAATGVDADTASRVLPEITDVAAQWVSQVEPRSEHKKRVVAALGALKISTEDPAGKTWLKLASSDFAPRAHRSGLGQPRPIDPEFLALWESTQAMLDDVLGRVAVTFLPFLDRVRALAAEEQPTTGHRKALFQEIPQEESVVMREFFAHATPGWLDMLVAKEMFADPPPNDPGGDGSWPQADYLARIAPRKAARVAEIVAGIRTDNPVVHDQLLAAALALPPVHAARVVPAAKDWVQQPFRLYESRPFGLLVAHLAQGGFVAEAADLARSVLGVVEPAGSGATPEQQEMSRWMRGPQARIGTWEYSEVLREDIPVLAERDAQRAFVLLRDLLAEAVAVKNKPRPFRAALEDSDRQDARSWGLVPDGSRYWYTQIGGGGDRNDVVDLLVDALYHHAEQTVAQDSGVVPGLVAMLEAARYAVFHRLALHFLSRHPQHAVALVRERIVDPARFDEEEIRPEYDALVGAGFPLLDPNGQAQYLAWVDEGLRGMASRYLGSEYLPTNLNWTDEEEDRWAHDRLAPIVGHLGPEWAKRFESIRRRIVDAEAARRAAVPAVAPQAGADDVLAMGTAELIQAAERGHTDGGTALPPVALTEAVARTPNRFASSAEQYAVLPASYRKAFLDGFFNAAQHGPAFGWGPVLSLTAVVAHAAAAGGYSEEWEATAERVVGVLEQGLSDRSVVKIPSDLLESMWPTLAVLVRHTALGHAGDGEESTRERGRVARLGRRTVNLLVQYGFHLREQRAAGGIPTSVPEEVASALEAYLSLPELDALWVRETFARQYPLLVSLGRDWAEAHREHVFPSGEGSSEEFRRAWDAYVAGDAWGLPAQVLAGEYARAIDDLADPEGTEAGPDLPGQRLAWHLMRLYFNGFIHLDEGGVLARFFRVAPAELRAHALELLARSLVSRRTVVTDEHLARLQTLWESRLAAARAGLVPNAAAELTPLGWWYGSGRFPEPWGFDRLRETLAQTGGRTMRPQAVVQRLAILSTTDPAAALDGLDTLARGATGPMEIGRWWDDAIAVVQAACAEAELRTRVEEMVNRLCAPPYAFPRAAEALCT